MTKQPIKRAAFSRYNQPVPCRMCGKKTTWSEVHGSSVRLCKACFEAASMENEHLDGHHQDDPNPGCILCQKSGGSTKAAQVSTQINQSKDSSKNMKNATKKHTATKVAKTVASTKVIPMVKPAAKPLAVEYTEADMERAKVLAQGKAADAAKRKGSSRNAKAPKKPVDVDPKLAGLGLVKAAEVEAALKQSFKIAKAEAAAKAKAEAEKPKKAPAKPAAEAAAEPEDLRIRLWDKGEFYFRAGAAAERIGNLEYMIVNIVATTDGITVSLIPSVKAEGNSKLGSHHGVPVLRGIGKTLKEAGWSGTTQDLIAEPIGKTGFKLVLDPKPPKKAKKGSGQ